MQRQAGAGLIFVHCGGTCKPFVMLSKLTLALAAVLLANTCNRQGNTETLLIKESKAPCTGVAPMECLQVKHEKDTAWTLFYSNIEGFDYQPGYQYKLLVSVSEVKNPPADASSRNYKLEKVLEKKKADANPWDLVKSKRWNLIQLNGKTLNQSNMWIEFDPLQPRFNGNGGCNRIGGNYEAAESQIQFKQVISTRMACIDDSANERESTFLRLLDSHTYKFDLADQTLNLYDSGKVVLMFGMQDKPAATQP
jgi:heat shock protein HslJ